MKVTKSGDIPIAKGISPQFMVEGGYFKVND